MKKFNRVCILLLPVILMLLGLGIGYKTANVEDVSYALAEQLPQTGEGGKVYNLPVEKNNGTYYLADYTRNIFMENARNSQTEAYEYTSLTGKFDDTMAVTVYGTLIRAYDFYADAANTGYSWKGINGKNDNISGNFPQNNEIPLYVLMHYGDKYENANCGYYEDYNCAFMYVGDGKPDGSLYMQGKAADVIAHEYQHAISDFAAAHGKGLEYLNETGAISEAVSDIFGSLIEGHGIDEEAFWTMGENAVPEDKTFLRSIKLPSNGYVMHISDEAMLCHLGGDHYKHGCDNGNTHYNSTIPTHAQYRMCQYMPEYFTREIVGKLWFSTLKLLSRTSDFEDFARQMIKASQQIGLSPEAQQTVEDCLFERGLIKTDTPTHIVTFVDDDGFLIEKITVKHGEGVKHAPSLDSIHESQGEQYFAGWDGDIDCVESDITVYPQREFRPYYVTVNFLCDGQTVKTERVAYGESASSPAVFKDSTEEFDYTFIGWDKDFSSCTQDMEVNALFSSTQRKYKVVFSYGETQEFEVVYGQDIPSFQPQKKGYIFEGWFLDENYEIPVGSRVEGNMTVYAKWSKDSSLSTSEIISIIATPIVTFALIAIVMLIIRKTKRPTNKR